ncbi:tryptophan-rich sensory protein [bacterium]|nr:tryptophan-rich sensory protein [bacterium]
MANKAQKNQKTKQTTINWSVIILYIAVAEAVGFISNRLCGDVKGFYQNLSLPPFAPAGWFFGVAWLFLYALMAGIVGWIHQNPAFKDKRARIIDLYWGQLFLNFCWSPIFFRYQDFMMATIIIAALIFLNYCLTVLIGRLNKKMGCWTWVYLLWLFFAAYLTLGVMNLN